MPTGIRCPAPPNVVTVRSAEPGLVWYAPVNARSATVARRLAAKAEQVWLFAKNVAVPWTNNAAEQALRGPKRHQAVPATGTPRPPAPVLPRAFLSGQRP
ncbi:hypothetical protein [Frankia sp. CiP1_Cm_nod1]|uniref:hypothetical protein n=1 Tax=Frankia sp. CiP1_Cm_nod1 TaxID=2897160 RepID=UPI004044D6E6